MVQCPRAEAPTRACPASLELTCVTAWRLTVSEALSRVGWHTPSPACQGPRSDLLYLHRWPRNRENWQKEEGREQACCGQKMGGDFSGRFQVCEPEPLSSGSDKAMRPEARCSVSLPPLVMGRGVGGLSFPQGKARETDQVLMRQSRERRCSGRTERHVQRSCGTRKWNECVWQKGGLARAQRGHARQEVWGGQSCSMCSPLTSKRGLDLNLGAAAGGL